MNTIELAKECGIIMFEDGRGTFVYERQIEELAEKIRADERERCANGWVDLRSFPKIEDGLRVWFGNEFGVWVGRWDSVEHHKGCGRAYPSHVMILNYPQPPIATRTIRNMTAGGEHE